MSDIIFGDVKLTVDGVPVEVSNVRWQHSTQPTSPRREIGDFSGSFTLKGAADQFAKLVAALQPRGYWLRRQLHTRRKLWRQIARALRLTYAEARDLCRSSEVEITR